MRVQTIRYQAIKHTERRAGACSACGVPTTRQRTFTMTVNPFNRRADGEVKTPAEVKADVLAEARKWTPNFDHENCAPIRAERVARKLKAGRK